MQKRSILLLALGIVFQVALFAKEFKYPVSEIPDSLKTNAKIVLRTWDQAFEYKSAGKGTMAITYALTVMNENGLDYAILQCPYSQKLNKVTNIRGAVYNASGEKIEALSNDKLYDVSAISGYSLFEDHRTKVFRPRTMAFPFTVEYSYTIDYDGLLSIPDWQPISGYNRSLMNSTYKLFCSKGLQIIYRERAIPGKVNITHNDEGTEYEWKINNIPAFIEQPFSEPFAEFCPNVVVVPQEIEIEGYRGSLSTWTSIGEWVKQLNAGKSELSPETVSLLREMIKDCSTDYEKAKKVYEYMQNKTRYLNITIGIGGWQPIPASTIDRLGYGDCKALSNYTKAMLDVIGVKSYYTLVGAGDDFEQNDINFPQINFNHAILCLPMAVDTLWLECTSQQLPFGYIGDFTDDRDVLLITETGGKISHTRAYKPQENETRRNIVITLDETGYATFKEISCNSGIQYSENLPLLLAGTEDKKKMILDNLNIPGALLNDFKYEEIRSEIPVLKETLNVEIPKYATLSGSRMLFSIVPVEKIREVPRKVNNRLSDVVIRRSKVSIDTITIHIPAGFQPESVPSEIKTDSRFGNYLLTTTIQNNQIVCVRRFEIKKGQHSPETYPELIDFFKKVAAADNSKASLKKTI